MAKGFFGTYLNEINETYLRGDATGHVHRGDDRHAGDRVGGE